MILLNKSDISILDTDNEKTIINLDLEIDYVMKSVKNVKESQKETNSKKIKI